MAAEAGLSILKAGGNAVDAAIATAAALAVCEPCSTGLGGDAFLLRYDSENCKVEGLNGSGRAPRALSLERARQDCGTTRRSLPLLHPHAATVPGAAGAWCDAVEAWGSLPLTTILEPAVRLAEDGFPVTPIIAFQWAEAEADLVQQHRARSGGTKPAGLLVAADDVPNGVRAPRVGELFRNPALAAVLRELGEGGKSIFYTGRVAREIVDALGALGGCMELDDLREHCERGSTRDEPVSAAYHGVEVFECAPNGQGITALLALRILDGLQPPANGEHEHGSAAHLHPLIEAIRLAFADARWFVADPEHARVPIAELLSDEYVASRRAKLRLDKATADVRRGSPIAQSNTVSFQVVDATGCAVSMVNSNFHGFGTAIVPTACGFSLQNRGCNFTLEPGHPNCLAGGKRPFHTIIPAMALKDGALFASFTNMGGFMQPQGHVQLIVNMVDYGMEPQAAIDAPRFCIGGGNTDDEEVTPCVYLEEGIGEEAAGQLRSMGHAVEHGVGGHERARFGRAQIIQRLPTGVLWAGSDGRSDGMAVGW
uniref:Gamma-glutamyltransferase n=1 Tax=Coccolithus braarudii TaxID=221442 RepID=A0A7S0Q1H2_9EUKA